MSGWLREITETSARAQLFGATLAFVGIALAITAAVVKLRSNEHKRGLPAGVVAVLGVAGCAFVVAGALAYTQGAGRALPHGMLGDLHVTAGDVWGRTFLALALVVFVPAGALLATRGRPAAERVALVALGAPLVVAAIAIAWDVVAERHVTFDPNAGAGERDEAALRWVHDLGHLAGAAALVPWVAVGAAVVGLVALRRTRTSGMGLALGATVLVLGVAAFLGTRALAYDARHPLPRLDRVHVHDAWFGDWGALPERDPSLPCTDIALAPTLHLARRPPTLDGAALRSGAELEVRLTTQRRNWSILHPLQPFPGVLVIVRDDGVPGLRTDDAFAIARRVGYDGFISVAEIRTPIHTRTRDTIVIETVCAQRLPRLP